MGRLKKIAAFMLVWLAAMPVCATVLPAPRLAAVQREKEIRLQFSWDAAVDFSENTKADRYVLTFLAQSSVPTGRLKQILTALPSRWRQMELTQNGGQLVFLSFCRKTAAFLLKKTAIMFLLFCGKRKKRRAGFCSCQG